jgi:hypothetical protein
MTAARTLALRASTALLATLCCLLPTATPAAAHELAMDELLLMWTDANPTLLRGQFTANPHRTRGAHNTDENPHDITKRVLAQLQQSVVLEIDGKRCATQLSLRELWVPAGAALGDIVMLHCPLARPPHRLRVFAGQPLTALLVSLQRQTLARHAVTHSVLVQGNDWSPVYEFDRPSTHWSEGGAVAMAPDAQSTPVTATPSTATLSVPDAQLSANTATPNAADAQHPPAVPPPFSPATSRPRMAPSPFTLTPLAAIKSYGELGIRHILIGGWDHVAFVLALTLGAAGRFKRLFWQLTLFTLAHSLTLSLGALGLLLLPPTIIEPLIALSIVCMALVNLLPLSAAGHGRALLVLFFGLLHGQGFAGALRATGLPRDSLIWALLSFNIGVELGQLAVVAALLVVLRILANSAVRRRYATLAGSIAVALLGLYWTLARWPF